MLLSSHAEVIRCVAHDWEYNLTTGEPLFGVGHRKLKTFPVFVEDEKAWVVVGPRVARAKAT
jgi:nitrite reductase/ring-hydroxylating ferredoxin subunit